MDSKKLMNFESFEEFAAKKLGMSVLDVKKMLDEHESDGFDRYNLAKCNMGQCFDFAEGAEIWQAAILSEFESINGD
ncbi:MAG: hypothetical protein RR563_09165 [Acinetobacter sp.]